MLVNGINWIVSSDNTLYPHSHAIVSLSTYRRVDDMTASNGTTVDAAITSLLAHNLIVIASANNQNGDACTTTPGRLSKNNPAMAFQKDVITVGGSMLINHNWTVNLADAPDVPVGSVEADGGGGNGGIKGIEPSYSAAQAVREARWICGSGDSSPCSNTTATASPIATGSSTLNDFYGFEGGSNAGPCVTLFAPAKNIWVATNTSSSDYRDARIRGGRASGTSWSAPIAAGLAARILQNNSAYTPAEMRTALLANCASTLDTPTLDSYDSAGTRITGTPNKMLRLNDVNIITAPQSTAAPPSGPTSLIAGGAGTTTVSYQWYKVNAGFDMATYRNGAHSSTAISGATSGTYQAPADTLVQGYWCRISNSCGTADTDIAVVVPLPGAPSNVLAEATNSTSVTVTWSSGAGAEKYEVQRKIAGQAWTRAAMVNGSPFSETPTVPGGMVVYRVRSVSGTAYLQDGSYAYSSWSNDFANLRSFDDEPLASPPLYTTIKAQHVIELRAAINALCDATSAPREYSDAEVLLSSLQGQPVRAVDLDSSVGLMKRINNVRLNPLLNMSAASWTSTPPFAGGVVSAQHLRDLRNALK